MTAQARAISIAPGTQFAGFEVLSLWCAGLVSNVWAAAPAIPSSRFGPGITAAKIAIKALRPPFSLDAKHRERMAREIAVHAELAHPNIVRVVDGSLAEGMEYLALEHVDGLTLRELLAAGGGCPVPVGVALTVAASLCDALDYVHERRGGAGSLGLVHGAVSPDNVMVDRSGMVKLLDFGEAVATLGAPPSMGRASFPEISTLASGSERYLAQLQYIAPERLEGKRIDRRSDVYAVGAVLFELLSGAPPFDANDLFELASRISAGDMRRGGAGLEAPVAALVTEAMHLAPDARPATARELAGRIRAALDPCDGGSGAVVRCVHQAIGLGAPVLELEDDPPDTLRPEPGTELDQFVHELLLATSDEDELLSRDPAGDGPSSASAADAAGRTGLLSCTHARARHPAWRPSDVFRTFALAVSEAERAELAGAAPAPAGERPNVLTAAVEFEEGWRALGEGRGWEALAAWERALLLDPRNATYTLEVGHLRDMLRLQ